MSSHEVHYLVSKRSNLSASHSLPPSRLSEPVKAHVEVSRGHLSMTNANDDDAVIPYSIGESFDRCGF